MSGAKQQHAESAKAKSITRDIDNLVLSSGDIIVVGEDGLVRIIAKPAESESPSKAHGVFIGYGLEAAVYGDVLADPKAKEERAHSIEDFLILDGYQVQSVAESKARAAKPAAGAHAPIIDQRLEFDRGTGTFALKRTASHAGTQKIKGVSNLPSISGVIVELDETTGHIVARKDPEERTVQIWGIDKSLLPQEGREYPAGWSATFRRPAEIVTGSGSEVRRLLDNAPKARFVTVRIDDQDEEQAAATEGVFAHVAEYLPQLIGNRQEERIRKLVEAVLPPVAISPSALAQAKMLIEARSSILKSGDFVSAKDVSKLAGYSETNPSAFPNKWKRLGKIFAIQSEKKDYFPLYALDPKGSYQPRPEIGEVLRIFGDSKDGWSVAFWFASLNSFLDDERPQDLLATEPDRVVAAAEDEMAEVEHG